MLATGNKRVKFKPDVQEQINKLDTKPGVTSKNNPPKCKPRIINDDVSARTRSKAIQLDQNIGVSTRSKLQRTYKLNVQTLLFPLHDVIPLSNHGKFNNEDLQLGVKECKTYHDGLMLVWFLIAYVTYIFWIWLRMTETHRRIMRTFMLCM